MRGHWGFGLPVAAALVALPASARAQYREEPRAHGVEASVGLGYGSFTDTSSGAFRGGPPAGATSSGSDFSGSIGFHLNAGYRFVPVLSAGLHVAYQALGNGDAVRTAGYTYSRSALAVGVYVRVYPLPSVAAGRVEPWVGLGLDFFARGNESATLGGATFSGHVAAVGIPLSLGVDYNIVRGFAVGPTASLSLWIPSEVCLAGNPSICFNDSLSNNVYWFVGLGARYTLPL